jgi:hypothetical protein
MRRVARALLLLAAAACLPDTAAAFPGQFQSRDFNGDGKQDLLFTGAIGSGAAGLVRIDLMDGLAVLGETILKAGGGTLRIATVGDVDGDGRSDLVFQGVPGTTGAGIVRIDRLSDQGVGVAVVQQTYLPDGGGAWAVRGVVDTDGDGAGEILSEGLPGTAAFGFVRVQRVTGGAVAGAGFVPAGNGAWQLFGAQDMDGDGTRDLIFRGAPGSLADGLVRIDSLAGDGLTVTSEQIAVTGFPADALVGAGPGVLTFALPAARRWVLFGPSGPTGFLERVVRGAPIYTDPGPFQDLGAMDFDGDGRLDWVLTEPSPSFSAFPLFIVWPFEVGAASPLVLFPPVPEARPTDARDLDGDGMAEGIFVAVGQADTGVLVVRKYDPVTGISLATGYVSAAGGAWRLLP